MTIPFATAMKSLERYSQETGLLIKQIDLHTKHMKAAERLWWAEVNLVKAGEQERVSDKTRFALLDAAFWGEAVPAPIDQLFDTMIETLDDRNFWIFVCAFYKHATIHCHKIGHRR